MVRTYVLLPATFHEHWQKQGLSERHLLHEMLAIFPSPNSSGASICTRVASCLSTRQAINKVIYARMYVYDESQTGSHRKFSVLNSYSIYFTMRTDQCIILVTTTQWYTHLPPNNSSHQARSFLKIRSELVVIQWLLTFRIFRCGIS